MARVLISNILPFCNSTSLRFALPLSKAVSISSSVSCLRIRFLLFFQNRLWTIYFECTTQNSGGGGEEWHGSRWIEIVVKYVSELLHWERCVLLASCPNEGGNHFLTAVAFFSPVFFFLSLQKFELLFVVVLVHCISIRSSVLSDYTLNAKANNTA